MTFAEWLEKSPGKSARRLEKALLDTAANAVDFAVLLRGALRAESLERGYPWEIELPSDLAVRLLPFSKRTGLVGNLTSNCVRAIPWNPKWIAKESWTALDSAFLPFVRRPNELCPGDPILGPFDLSSYTSTAQRDAVRATLCAQSGDTLAICLPTGSGKSLCAFLPAALPMTEEDLRIGVSLIVVPTVALSLDLESRLQARIGHQVSYRPTKKDEAEAIRLRCEAGVQGPIIVSPEALGGALLKSLRKAARAHFLRYFIVDEAHIVLSWGDEFRPAFLQLAAVRRELSRLSKKGLVTLLMSATFTDYHLRWLRSMFSEEGRFSIVHAARLRPEPAYWIESAKDEQQRREWIEEALFHLPRPCVLYTTHRKQCEYWHSQLKGIGFHRVGMMHGDTSEDMRSNLLAKWKADEIDLVVATSAFGLGVDKQDVRTIIHAQLPESVDRFYQDVGRSGRDGAASISLLVTTPKDRIDVARIGKPKFISTQLGLDRWKVMYRKRQTLSTNPQTILIDLNSSRELDMSGDYNRSWNIRTLQLLQRAGALDFIGHDEADFNHVAVRPNSVPHTDSHYWNSTIQALRIELFSDNRAIGQLLEQLISGSPNCLSNVFRTCYSSTSLNLGVITACGGCPNCRSLNLQPSCGRIMARRIPPGPMIGGVLGMELTNLFNGRVSALIHHKLRSSRPENTETLGVLFTWLASNGVRNFVVPANLENLLKSVTYRNTNLICFYHQRPPRNLDVTAYQPTVVVLEQSEPDWWPRYYSSLGSQRTPTVLVLPKDTKCPNDGGRFIRDVFDGTSLDISDWEDRFVA